MCEIENFLGTKYHSIPIYKDHLDKVLMYKLYLYSGTVVLESTHSY